MPPALWQSAFVFAAVTSAANAGAVKASANARANIEIRAFMAFSPFRLELKRLDHELALGHFRSRNTWMQPWPSARAQSQESDDTMRAVIIEPATWYMLGHVAALAVALAITVFS